jgi:O-antigen/teichoic acid export membrane protein
MPTPGRSDVARRRGSIEHLRAQARRRGGAQEVTLGFVLVGGSAFVLLGLGARLLGAAAFSGVGVIWTLATVFGVGVATPTEQLINRRMNAASPHPIRTPMYVLTAVAAATALVSVAVVGRLPSATALPAMVVACLVAIGGWLLTAGVRGRLAGRGDLRAYAVVLATEAGCRIGFALLALMLPGQAGVLLPAAVGLPLVIASLVGLYWTIPSTVHLAPRSEHVRWEQASFVLVSLGFQATVNLAALLIEARVGATQPAAAGEFVSASTYFRVPLVLIGGVLTTALVVMSTASADRDLVGFRRSLKRSTFQTGAITLLSSILLLALAAILLPIYYGRTLTLPVGLYAGLAVSTVVAGVGSALTQSLLATGRSSWAGGAWLVGAAVTVGGLMTATEIGTRTTLALVSGPVVATLLLLGSVGAAERGLRADGTVRP